MSEVSTQTLHVVARELSSELNDARAALELFGEQQEDVEQLQRCRAYLRQVRGALRVVEVFGAALLVEEMEQLTQYLIENFAEKRHLAEGLDALMRAMVQLPTYLERVLSGGRDMALILLPLLNDLRAVRGNPLLSEGTLLLLNLSSDKQANPIAPAPGELALPVAQWARKLRTRFQLGLLGWIKGERIDQNLEVLARTAEKLEQVATTQPVFQLWWVVGAVIEALREGGLEGSASIKRLLGQADRELRRLYEQGEARYGDRPPLDLLNNLLYYVGRATSSGPRVSAVRASFRLSELLPVDQQVEAARESLSAPSVKLMKTVAGAIKEDLGRVKDALDIFVRKGGSQAEELAPQLELLKKIGDTLGVLGLGELREKVQSQIAGLQTMLNGGGPPDDAQLLGMASTLISIEDGLDEQLVGLIMPNGKQAPATGEEGVNDAEFRQVTEAVLRECIVNMARIKEAIALAVEKPHEAQALDQIPQLVHGITAGLLMLGKSRAVDITERIAKALAKYARNGATPTPSDRMDRLADAIVAIEYYMETLQAGRSDPWYMLDNADNCLKALDELSSGTSSLLRLPELTARHRTTPQASSPQPAEGAAYPTIERTEVLDRSSVPPPANVAATAEPELPPVLLRPEDKADPEFLELFIEEARDEITKLQSLLPRWDDNPQDAEALNNARRSFHTLKGSGRLVGAQLIGEFAWSMENMLNRVISKTLERTPEMMALLKEAVATLPELVEQLEVGTPTRAGIGSLIAQAQALAGGREPFRHSAPKVEPVKSEELAPTLVETTAAEMVAEAPANATPASEEQAAETQMDPVLHDIFAKEARGHLAAIRDFIDACAFSAPPYPVTEALHRACHTLSGTAKTAGARQGIKIAEPLNHYIRKLFDNGANLPAEGLAVLKDSVAAIDHMISHINENTAFFSSDAGIIERLQHLEHNLDTELSSVNAAQDATGITRVDDYFKSQLTGEMLSVEPVTAGEPEIAATPAQSLAPAEIASPPLIEPDADESEAWIDLTEFNEPAAELPLAQEPSLSAPEVADSEILHTSTTPSIAEEVLPVKTADTDEVLLLAETGSFEIDEPALQRAEPPAPEAVVETSAWAQAYAPPTLDEPAPVDAAAAIHEAAREQGSANEESVDAAPAFQPSTPTATDDEGDDEFDADIAAIFTEEAAELLEAADTALSRWYGDRSNAAHAFELKRALHTLKGGARMAGIRAMGDLSHELESFMQSMESGLIPSNQVVFDTLLASLDELHRMRDVLSQGRRVAPAHDLIARVHALSRGEVVPEAVAPQAAPQTEPQTVAESALSAEPEIAPAPPVEAPEVSAEQIEYSEIAVDFLPEDLGAASVPETLPEETAHRDLQAEEPVASATFETEEPVQTPAAEQAAPVALPPGREPQVQERGEMARVDAELLDTLLNNAGEVSIFRSRLEQQVTSLDFNLSELDRVVARLKDQLRKMEIETEAQILHKFQDEHKGREDFDPLELDRYSTIQQLSRALAESVSDVASIQGLLQNLGREAQNLLLQQSRVVTELQNGLMRTRMVPFSRHVQRLTRLVRQVAADTGKRAELVVTGAQGELDRQVLERMLPAFEHMLRNSVVHGIEAPEDRRAVGKPEVGTIKVALHREGTEMVIVIADDGRGIDVQAVREQARVRGLIQPGRILTDEEALQLILEPGFSTASSLTQHAGRGVGMDVVVNEVKKLGGALVTASIPGQGANFTIRLPFTLAISQALIVRVGELELYALPLPTAEGVVRLPSSEVAAHLAEDAPTFSYGGQAYRFQHLGSFLGVGPSVLPENDAAVPVILIKAGEHSTALVTDELIGNREIVVKSVGPQISSIRGIAGATILGDGRVVIILDMGALARSDWRARPILDLARGEDHRVFALVVDDSITVRRVTQRLLERNGMRVMTAKDGVDALAILQEHVPDIILLDIEMPRMDGYELATHVRSDARLAEIPIVMITSRVSEKHRARAIEIGVNDYLGKPYQENQLLDAIEPLVAGRRRQHA